MNSEFSGYFRNRYRRVLLAILLLLSSCSWPGSERVWDNPYDPAGTRPAKAPVIEDLTDDTVVVINDTLVMHAGATSVNAQVTGYLWSFDNGVTTERTDEGTLVKTWGVSDSGTYTVLVSAVNEWDMESEPETFTVTVRSCYPVLAEKIQDASVSQLAVVERTFFASDSNGSITTYFWGTGSEGWDDSATGDEGVTTSFDNPEGGTLHVRWAARDDDGLMVYDTFDLIFNRRPENVRLTMPEDGGTASFVDFDLVEGVGTAVCSYTADDPDERDVLTYTFFCGFSAEDTVTYYTGTDTSVPLSGIPASTELVWSLLVNDRFGDTATASGTFTTAPPPRAPEGMVLVRARGRCYNMGQSGFNPAEEPIHQVCFSSHFWMDSTEVTVGEFASVTGVDVADGGASTMPVTNISWYDAVLYCNALSNAEEKDTVYSYTAQSGETGKKAVLEGLTISASADGYRLPTEAEWEFACKADSLTLFFWGNDQTVADSFAWTKANSGAAAHTVGEKLPNASGLYDMSGNVWEWCQDWFDAGYYAVADRVDPPGPQTGITRVMRGGSWNNSLFFSQAGTRASLAPQSGDATVGFRTVLPIR